ncbi:SNAPIN protein homolog [Chironomus tepperi]|uniref:SNAPIN protein homolog n=1 Tax=Chironomus tepperi TaxID=113505 RepID=UPI00391F532E
MSDSDNSVDEDITENFIENPTRELLAEGFLGFFSPIVENLDSKVKQTSLVQLNVNAQLDILQSIIKDQISRQSKQDTAEFDRALKSLNAIKSRVTVLSNVLQTAQDRLISMNERVTAINQTRSINQ